MPIDQEPKQAFWNRQITGRGLGVVILACGATLTYISIIRPLLAAARHEQSVSLSLKGVMFSPILVAIGVFYLALGQRATRIMGQHQKPSAIGWLIFALTCGTGILIYQWLKST